MYQNDGSSTDFWNGLYELVLEGKESSPRGRRTIEVQNVSYKAHYWQHYDTRPGRVLSLPYVAREFLWFLTGDRFDVRMAKYAPIWKACIGYDGGINSNYGQYLFRPNTIIAPFYNALDKLQMDSRRCWIPIFQTEHQNFGEEHGDYPCTTGMGFRINGDELQMNVHMRSQDLYWGAANDEPVCYLLQLLALAYLREYAGKQLVAGPIVHSIDSLHIYERHFKKAIDLTKARDEREDVLEQSELCEGGFTDYDFLRMTYPGLSQYTGPVSPLLNSLLSIPGDYGYEDTERSWR